MYQTIGKRLIHAALIPYVDISSVHDTLTFLHCVIKGFFFFFFAEIEDNVLNYSYVLYIYIEKNMIFSRFGDLSFLLTTRKMKGIKKILR